MKQSIGFRYGLIIAALVMTIAGITTTSVLINVDQATRKFTETNQTIITANTTTQAIAHAVELAKQLSLSLANPLYYYDVEAIGQLLDIATAQADITQILVLDSDHSLVRDSNNPLAQLGIITDLDHSDKQLWSGGAHYQLSNNNIYVNTPIHMHSDVIGHVYVTLSLHNFFESIAAQSAELQRLRKQYSRELFINAVAVTALLLILGIVLAIVIARNLTKPINVLVDFARLLGQGQLNQRITLKRDDEFEELATQLNTMARDIQQHNQQLEYFANYDNLTGLCNRRHFKLQLTELLEQNANHSFAVAIIDIDDFKLVNSLHGQGVGDLTIIALAKRLDQLLARLCNPDQSTTYTLAHFTGDKFIVCLHAPNIAEITQRIVEQLLAAVRAVITIHGLPLQLTASIGVALSHRPHISADRLINNASTAMYLVKGETKNNIHIYNNNDAQLAKRQSALIADFSNALTNGELELWYQPQYDLQTAKIYGVEALLRWKHPQLGLILPAKFLSLIERHELTHKLGIWTLHTSLQMLTTLAQKAPDIALSINMSPEQLQRDDLLNILSGYDREQPGRLTKLTIEVTETLWTNHHTSTLAILRQIAALGVKISLDDFATGHSSLSLLNDFPIDEIKLDQSFVRNLHSNPQNYALSKAIVGIAQAFNIGIVAEGVETELELGGVIQLGCHNIQGFLFNPALPQAELFKTLNDSPALVIKHNNNEHA